MAPGYLPDFLGIQVLRVDNREVELELQVQQKHLAPNDYLHGGNVVALADTAAGYGALANLPDDAKGFTAIELKSNFLGIARDGTIRCLGHALHRGRTTQVWDARIWAVESNKIIAQFRCAQMVLY